MAGQMIDELLNKTGFGIISCSMDGTIEEINSNVLDIFELKDTYKGIEELPGKKIFELAKEYKELFSRIGDGDEGSNSCINFTTPAGNHKHVSCFICHDKEADKIEILLYDETRRNELEFILRRSERKLQSIIDIIPDIVYRLDPEGYITFISDSVKLYGYDPDKLHGTHIMDLVHPEDRDKSIYRVNERRTGERKTKFFEVRLLAKDREPVPFEFEYTFFEDNFFSVSAEGIYVKGKDDEKVFVGTQGIARDITRRKVSDSVIQQNEKKVKDLLEGLEDGYYEVDLHGKLIYANTSLCEMWGYTMKEMLNKSYTEFMEPSNKEHVFEVYNEVYRTGKPAKVIDWIARRKDGKKRYVEGSVSLIYKGGSVPVGFRGILRDNTERYKLEQNLLRARKLEAIGIFSGGIAHDYNNALTAIIGNISLAKMEVEPGSELLDILNDAEKASLKVKDLTQRLSSFSKGGRPVKKVTGLKHLLEDVTEMALRKYKGDWEIKADDSIEASIDEFQITHALENLLVNSMDADPEGKGKIVVSAEYVDVEKEKSHHEISLQPGEYIKITVSDTGEGIEVDQIDKIFDPYYSTRELKSGMGLALTYAVIKRHRGYIDVESRSGEGTVVNVYLPVPDEFEI